MQVQADSEHWRRKYFDALRSLEQEERGFRSLEGLLRRVVNRLCFAAMGQTSELDAEVGRLTDAMRRKVGEADLERLFVPLSEAIAALDARKDEVPVAAKPVAVVVAAANRKAEVTWFDPGRPATALTDTAQPQPSVRPAAEDVCGDERIRSTLSRLLQEVRREGSLAARADEIETLLLPALTPAQLPVLLTSIADLLVQRISAVEREKREVESLLSQITGRLDEMSAYIDGEQQERKLSLESTHEFNTRLVGEMHELGTSVDTSIDMIQLKLKVRARLDSIGEHLQEFREREAERANSHWERSEKMRERVERLEGEARNLHDRLRDEQRLAMIDGLTQIPNRLSYDQRLVEEFKRWQRFNQPTCIVAWDVDHFKKINDAYGHRAGDKVLRIVADCLAGNIRETDFLARYGGEEFVMILPGTTAEDALSISNKIREAVATLGFHFRGSPVSVAASCGITALLTGDSADDAFDRADKALYLAKESGRNRCIVG